MEDSRDKAYRMVAYSALVFGMVALLGASITLPMIYNQAVMIRQSARLELRTCKVSYLTAFKMKYESIRFKQSFQISRKFSKKYCIGS